MSDTAPNLPRPSDLRAARLFDMSGQSVVVTGAAGGIGYQMAHVAACNGAHVTLIDVDARRLEASAAGLSASGFSVRTVALDVTDTEALERAVDDTAARHGRLDAVFANAGISAGPGFAAGQNEGKGSIRQIDTALWDRVIATNLTSVMHTIRISAGHMVRRGYGRIVVTASVAGLRAEPFVNYAYAVAKAGRREPGPPIRDGTGAVRRGPSTRSRPGSFIPISAAVG